MTCKSDVYALAVTFWELWSNGEVPFAGVSNKSVTTGIINGNLRLKCQEQWPISHVLESIFRDREFSFGCGDRKGKEAKLVLDRLKKLDISEDV